MVALVYQKHLRTVQNLPFCYLCGREFIEGEKRDSDHVPPKSVYASGDQVRLWLPTHLACNREHQLVDEKIGQLIGLRRRKKPKKPRLKVSLDGNTGLIRNLDIESAVRRWVRGFHAALYREPIVKWHGAIVTLFRKAIALTDRFVPELTPQQHELFVETIKLNRAKRNLDRIETNNGALRYECVWCQSDNSGPWLCIFALDLYDWKELGHTDHAPARGCAGFYVRPGRDAPDTAARAGTSLLILPNVDKLDPFGR